MQQAKNSTQTIHAFEWARAFGAIAVVLIHVFATLLDNADVATVGVPTALAWSEIQIVIARWAVPVFFMITGALLLDPRKELPWEKLVGHIKRISIAIVLFGYPFCLAEAIANAGTIGFGVLLDALTNLLSVRSWSHMWYLYALLGLYLLTPVLRAFVAQATAQEQGRAVLILFLLTCVVPTLNSALGTRFTTLVWVTSSVFYYLLGYYAFTYARLTNAMLITGAICILFVCVATGVSIVVNQDYLNYLRAPACCLIAPYSYTVFLLFKQYFSRPVVSPFMKTVARNSFGIYLTHPIFLNVLYKVFDWIPGKTVPHVIFELCAFAIAFIGALVLTSVLRRLPVLRNVL